MSASSAQSLSDSGSITNAPAANNTVLYIVIGAAVLVIAFLFLRKK